jgi:uncharacterized protein (TIGR00288 family)
MNGRHPRTAASSPASRTQGALIHRGPGAMAATHPLSPLIHAPNAALLIDFDNVTMGIRSDLGKELRTLLSSDIIKGKVAVQRAYADWRRYPQYIVPLSEASIDLIFAPAYGSSKKNATDIRLAIDALELVFTRPEIGTFILLSGDSDFSSLVIKLKEYGKYVIGVGIRESSSDLLVQNCDEYYSYNALAGLVKASEEEPARKFDPWELVGEAVTRMKRNGDVMRSDRLKQVMQDIDPGFDEKNLGMSKFSRFVQQAAERGLLTVTKLENGQLEIGPPSEGRSPEPEAGEVVQGAVASEDMPREAPAEQPASEREERGGRRGRRGRGRGRGREERGRPEERERAATSPVGVDLPAALAVAEEPVTTPDADSIGVTGERLTRNEAFDIVRRAVETLTTDDEDATRASAVRRRAREILGRDSESLNERMFIRILKDAHDAGVIDLRRRGDDFEVARAAEAAPVSEQVARADAAATPTRPLAASTTPRLGMGPRGAGGGRGRPRLEGPPPELLTLGIVEQPPVAPAPPVLGVEELTLEDRNIAPAELPNVSEETKPEPTPRRRGTGRKRGRPTPVLSHPAQPAAVEGEERVAGAPEPQASRKSRAKTAAKTAHRRARARKTAPKSES